MVTPVLATKLFVPPRRTDAVARPHLIARLQQAFDSGRTLTIVSAPAGCGKTTLVADWVATLEHNAPPVQVAWLSLDPGDNDPVRFLTHLVAALQRIDASIGSAALTLPSHSPEASETALTALINDVTQATTRIVLVLDDFHYIDALPVRRALAFLVDHLPERMHLVVASRSDPPLPLARLRARGDLTEVRAADLRFTSAEASAFLSQVMHLQLEASDVSALEARTEGWIAGLQLAGLSLQGRSDPTAFVQAFTGSHRFVIDYLAEEVLQRQAESVRDFLLQTSILDRLSGSLCDAVTGLTTGSAMLEELERNNLFVVPLDDRREWFRYHHLFVDVLRARMLREGRQQAPALHVLASSWYEDHNLPEDAVHHALAAADVERAARLIEQALPVLRRRRRDVTLLDWIRRLPRETLAAHPVLSVHYAWSLLIAGDLPGVELSLADAERALRATGTGNDGGTSQGVEVPDGEELRTLPVMIEVYRAALAQAHNDVSGQQQHARRALDLAEPDDHFASAAAGGFLGLAAWAQGDLEAGLRAFGEVRTNLALAGNAADVLGTTVVLADMMIPLGRLSEAQRAFEQALRDAAALGDAITQPVADLHVGLSGLHWQHGELTVATEHLRAAQALGERASLPENRYRWFTAKARIHDSEGEFDAALQSLAEADRLYARGFFPDVAPIAALTARVWIRQGRLREARSWAASHGLTATDALTYRTEFEHVTLARLLLAEYRQGQLPATLHTARTLLDRLLTAAQTGGRTGSATEILVLQALLQGAAGRTDLALVPLERALRQAEPDGYVRLFADEGAPMDALLRAALHRGIRPEYVRRLRRALLPHAGDGPAPEPGENALSERELHVLRLLGTELSGPQIAGELFVSVNTLRTHTRHIFGKLAVNSRVAAVRRARELGLL
ncbi:helix-turn-helix transcriptional regulator [Cryobacterium melibiosiphilum]|uniref:Helix-turn-helix transcriptional regulator n=1 Tax=Cryobacterium melibiosiphilum TaxID=995039 RepID=A0A3A5MCP1_9MICO|nr:LuxR C-terminal-related transcriptional regulator [Cryobacterium melibiosiphilum]RJT85615.1 helix-turn-helix transcriptional regulator [Cryobacterium melibiosiphilum]